MQTCELTKNIYVNIMYKHGHMKFGNVTKVQTKCKRILMTKIYIEDIYIMGIISLTKNTSLTQTFLK